jgi:hypothetical protein
MTRATPEFDQRIADWLEDDPNLAPSQVTATVLAALPSIHQRRRGWFHAGGRTFPMPNSMRAFAAIAIVAVVGVAALTLLRSAPGPGGPGPSPTPSPIPTASPIPTQAVVDLGTITLTNDGCSWAGNPGAIVAPFAPLIGRVAVVNETDTFANFGIYRLDDGRTWAEAAAWIAAENDALHGGPSNPPIDFVTDVGSIDAPESRQYAATVTLDARGTHGIVCSSNEPPPGLVFATYVVGPLEVTIGP